MHNAAPQLSRVSCCMGLQVQININLAGSRLQLESSWGPRPSLVGRPRHGGPAIWHLCCCRRRLNDIPRLVEDSDYMCVIAMYVVCLGPVLPVRRKGGLVMSPTLGTHGDKTQPSATRGFLFEGICGCHSTYYLGKVWSWEGFPCRDVGQHSNGILATRFILRKKRIY